MSETEKKITPEMVAEYASKDSRAIVLVETKDLMDELVARLMEGNYLMEKEVAKGMVATLGSWAESKDYDTYALGMFDPIIKASAEWSNPSRERKK